VQKLFLIFFVILLSACNLIPQPTLSPAETIVLKPSATPTVTPSPTPTEIPSTLSLAPATSSIPTPDPYFFRDDFVGTLDAQWSWVREDSANWSITAIPGSLQINVGGGYVPAHNNSNLLLRPAPEGDFQIETQITFKPTGNFQFAGLIIYESDSNFIQAGRAYCSSVGCKGEGLYMDHYRKGTLVRPNWEPTQNAIDPISIRLSRAGDTYNFEVSADGEVWFSTDSQISDINPRQIGLVAGQKLGGAILPAAFDYFEVRSLP